MKEKHELAYNDYLSGMKQKDIAAKYNVSINTVKSWSRRHKWSRKSAPQKLRVHPKEVASKMAEKMVENNTDLNEERQLFCIYYLKYHNQVKAYMKVKPNSKYDSASVLANRWMKEPAVKKEIDRLKKERFIEALLDPQDIVQKYIDIAFADLNDYLEYGRETVQVMGPFEPVMIKNEDGSEVPLTKEINIVKFKDSAYCDGTILSEVRQGRYGASIKLSDRMKALDWLAEHMGIATDEQKAKVELLKAQCNRINSSSQSEDEDDDVVVINNDLQK